MCMQEEKCEPHQYWNKLACECFNVKKCDDYCPPGSGVQDPMGDCGACRREKDIFDAYYPKWATPFDINNAHKDGIKSKYDK